MLDWYKWFCL